MRDEVSHLCRTELRKVARPPRLERGTPGLEGRCSIQLSYGRVDLMLLETGRMALSLSACSNPSDKPREVGRHFFVMDVASTQARLGAARQLGVA